MGDFMGRLPDGKVALSIYVTPKCKEKLDCLQRLYAVVGKSFSLSKIVEDSINFIYGVAYLCMDNVFWTAYAHLFKIVTYDESMKLGVSETLEIARSRKNAAQQVLTVPMEVKGRFWKVFIKDLKKDFSGLFKKEA